MLAYLSSMLFPKAASEVPARKRAASFNSTMNEMSVCKRVQPPARSIFTEASTLQLVLDYLGPGYALHVRPVCKEWNKRSSRVADKVCSNNKCAHASAPHVHTFRCTSMTAVWGSASSLRLARASGLFKDTPAEYSSLSSQFEAGRLADVDTLVAARAEYGLLFTSTLAEGAASTGCLAKLQQLFSRHGCPLVDRRGRHTICDIAAATGSVAMLQWLHGTGKCTFTAQAIVAAATAGHSAAVRCLLEFNCPWSAAAAAAVAEHCELELLQWLQLHHTPRCDWDDSTIAASAARSGKLEVLLYVLEQGADANDGALSGAVTSGNAELVEHLVEEHDVELRFSTMQGAVETGSLTVVQFLVQQHCPCPAIALLTAAQRGLLAILQCLHAAGREADARTLCSAAFTGGHADTALYLLQRYSAQHQQQPLAAAVMLCRWLDTAGTQGWLEVAQALRQLYAAPWPLPSTMKRSWQPELYAWSQTFPDARARTWWGAFAAP
jgi:hypothetical protein